MPSRKLSDLHPVLSAAWQKAVLLWADMYPNLPKPIITCTYRSNEEQTQLYAKGRTVKGAKVTNAKAGQSPHNQLPSLAFDVAFQNGGLLDWSNHLFDKFAGCIDNVTEEVLWGGRFQTFKDRPHFELKNWKQIRQQ